VGVARITLWPTPNSMSSGPCSKAVLKKVFPGRKRTTNSGARGSSRRGRRLRYSTVVPPERLGTPPTAPW
jgi:hypothetical protein